MWLHPVLTGRCVYSMPVWDQLFIAQKHPLCLGPRLFIKQKSKGPRDKWNEDWTDLKQVPGMLGWERVCSGVVQMFYGCIGGLPVFPRCAVHGVGKLYCIYQAYTEHCWMHPFQPRHPFQPAVAGLRVGSCGSPQTVPCNGAAWLGQVWRREGSLLTVVW